MFTRKLNILTSLIVVLAILLSACGEGAPATASASPATLYPEVMEMMQAQDDTLEETVPSDDRRFQHLLTAIVAASGGLSPEQKSIIMANGFKLKPVPYKLMVDGAELDRTVWSMLKGSLHNGDNYVVLVRFIRDEQHLITGAQYLKIPSSVAGSARLTRGYNGLIAGLNLAAQNAQPEAAAYINSLAAETKLVQVGFPSGVIYNGLRMPHYGPTLDWIKWSGTMPDEQIMGLVDEGYVLAGRLLASDATTITPGFVSRNGRVGVFFADPNLGNLILIRHNESSIVALIDFDNAKFYAAANEDSLALLWSYFQKARVNRGLPLSPKTALEALPEDLRTTFVGAGQMTQITDESGAVVATITRSTGSVPLKPPAEIPAAKPAMIIEQPLNPAATRLTLWEVVAEPVRQTLMFLNYVSWMGMVIWVDGIVHESFVAGDLKTYEVNLDPSSLLTDYTGPGINLDVAHELAWKNKTAIVNGGSLHLYFPEAIAGMKPVAESLVQDFGATPEQTMEATMGQFRDQLLTYSNVGSLQINVNGSGFFDHTAPILVDATVVAGHRRVTLVSTVMIDEETSLPKPYSVCDQADSGTWACNYPVADFYLNPLNADQQAGDTQHFVILGIDPTGHYLQILKVP